MKTQRTLVLIKPDAVAAGMTREIVMRFAEAGLLVVRSKKVLAALEKIESHYAEHEDKPFFDDLVGFMIREPLYAVELQGEYAVKRARDLIGATDPKKAESGTIRGDLCDDTSGGPRNLVHASDSAAAAQREIELWFGKYKHTVKMWVLPGGRLPIRKTEGSAALDGHTRAIVHKEIMDPKDPRWRKTMFDFKHRPDDPRVLGHVVPVPNPDGEGFSWSYRLPPKEKVLVGVGFATSFPKHMVYWLTPRSGLSTVFALTNSNAPGTVDSDYRGEAGVDLINHGVDPFDVMQHDRIIQVMFEPVKHPEIIVVDDYDELGETERAAGGFGSTGFRA